MKLLFLTETDSARSTLNDRLAESSRRLNMQMDVALTCGPVYTTEEKEKMESDDFHPVSVPGYHAVTKDKFWYDDSGADAAVAHIKELAEKNEYDYVVNACLPHPAGTVEFLLTRHLCGLKNIPMILEPDKELNLMRGGEEIRDALNAIGRILPENAYAEKLENRDGVEHSQEMD